MNENLSCSAPRDYESEINQLQKEMCCMHEELERVSDKNRLLEKCIVEMCVGRFVFNDR